MSEQSWTEVSSGLCKNNTVSDNNFPSAFTVTNRFSSLSVEYASLDPKDAVPQDVGIEDSHFQFTFASSQGAVTTENIGPTDFELLKEATAAVAEQKTSHLVTSAPTETVNSPLVVVDGISSETHCTYCGMPKGTCRANAMSGSEKIKPVALAVIELHLSEGIDQSVTQSVSQSLENSVK